MRSLRTTTKSSPRSPQLEEACAQQRRPNVTEREREREGEGEREREGEGEGERGKERKKRKKRKKNISENTGLKMTYYS